MLVIFSIAQCRRGTRIAWPNCNHCVSTASAVFHAYVDVGIEAG